MIRTIQNRIEELVVEDQKTRKVFGDYDKYIDGIVKDTSDIDKVHVYPLADNIRKRIILEDISEIPEIYDNIFNELPNIISSLELYDYMNIQVIQRSVDIGYRLNTTTDHTEVLSYTVDTRTSKILSDNIVDGINKSIIEMIISKANIQSVSARVLKDITGKKFSSGEYTIVLDNPDTSLNSAIIYHPYMIGSTDEFLYIRHDVFLNNGITVYRAC